MATWPRCTVCDREARPGTICNRGICPWQREQRKDSNDLRIIVIPPKVA